MPIEAHHIDYAINFSRVGLLDAQALHHRRGRINLQRVMIIKHLTVKSSRYSFQARHQRTMKSETNYFGR